MGRTRNEVLKVMKFTYLDNLDLDNLPSPDVIEAELLKKLNDEFEFENTLKPNKQHWKILHELPNSVIATIILRLHYVRRVFFTGKTGGKNYDLMMYQMDGEKKGTYVQDDDVMEKLIMAYNDDIAPCNIAAIMATLNRCATSVRPIANEDLCAVNNGVFDFKTKTLLPFSPDYIFVSKSAVNYNPLAVVSPIIPDETDGTNWDVEEWIKDLSGDKDVPELLWQVIGSIIRPQVPWDKVICFYSEQGNNGKGTLCELMRNLCGEESRASIPFANFEKDFALEELPYISAIIVDENATNDFTKIAADLKAVITGDTLTINRKFRKRIEVRFNGIMVQCLNDLPKFADKSDSLYRRFLMVPFKKCFTGAQKKYIKLDYLARTEVLEYVLNRVLNMDYYEFIEPQACLDLKNEYKINNDPVRQLLNEVLPELVWDLVPYPFLYALYKSWTVQNNPGGKILSCQQFNKQLKNVLIEDEKWDASSETAYPVRELMGEPELLIAEYDLREWMNPDYKGADKNLICQPALKKTYRGLRRK